MSDLNTTVAVIGGASGIVGTMIGATVSYFVARQQVRATVVSTSRREWIDTLRRNVAEVLGIVRMICSKLEPDTNENILDKMRRLSYLDFYIQLSLTPGKAQHDQLERSIDNCIKVIGDASLAWEERVQRSRALSGQVSSLTRQLLLAEWKSVKALE